MKTNKIMVIMLAIVSLTAIFGCDNSRENKDKDALLPVLGNINVLDISSNSATVAVTILSNGGATLSEKGVMIGSVKIKDTESGSSQTEFSVTVSNLEPNKNYTVKAYATNTVGTSYGKETIFKTSESLPKITDTDGNDYGTVVIGNQTWTTEDLRVTHYRDGSVIANISDNLSWSNLETGALCYYNNDASNKSILYNWYATSNSKGLAPDGWHVASWEDWSYLAGNLDGGLFAGGKMKEVGTAHWLEPNQSATNSSGFTALPTGTRNMYGEFSDFNKEARWFSMWTLKPEFDGNAVLVRFDNSYLEDGIIFDKRAGSAIRLVKDY